VLSPFAPEEQQMLPKVIEAAADGAQRWLEEGLEAAMQFVNNLQIA
jgi:peptidyl-tRNA hydrolase